jgi:hypothetical protein
MAGDEGKVNKASSVLVSCGVGGFRYLGGALVR